MNKPTLKEMAQSKKLKVGHFIVEFATPGIGHIMKSAGCDFVLLDMEHSGFSVETVKSLLRYVQQQGGLPGKLVVFLVCERGERSLGKVFNDEWMKRHGFLASEAETVPAGDVVRRKGRDIPQVVTLTPDDAMDDAIRIMREMDVSTIPVVKDGQVVGTVREEQVIDFLLHTPKGRGTKIEEIMEDPLPEVNADTPLTEVHQLFLRGNHAVLVRLDGGRREILTKYDLIHGLAKG